MPTVTKRVPPKRNAPLDWDAFMDGKQRICRKGKDFEGQLAKFQQRARHAAQRRDMKARTWTEGGDVIVQFYSPEGEST